MIKKLSTNTVASSNQRQAKELPQPVTPKTLVTGMNGQTASVDVVFSQSYIRSPEDGVVNRMRRRFRLTAECTRMKVTVFVLIDNGCFPVNGVCLDTHPDITDKERANDQGDNAYQQANRSQIHP